MASGRFQETRGRWEPVVSPTVTESKVIMDSGYTLKQTLESLSAEFATNQEILDVWRLSGSSLNPVSP